MANDNIQIFENANQLGDFIISTTDPSICNISQVTTENPISTFISEDINIIVIPGCNHVWAENYDPNVNCNDGSCFKKGCTMAIATNYDPYATINDGSCVYSISGCKDSSAINYNSSATYDDNDSCVFKCAVPYATNYNVQSPLKYSCVIPMKFSGGFTVIPNGDNDPHHNPIPSGYWNVYFDLSSDTNDNNVFSNFSGYLSVSTLSITNKYNQSGQLVAVTITNSLTANLNADGTQWIGTCSQYQTPVSNGWNPLQTVYAPWVWDADGVFNGFVPISNIGSGFFIINPPNTDINHIPYSTPITTTFQGIDGGTFTEFYNNSIYEQPSPVNPFNNPYTVTDPILSITLQPVGGALAKGGSFVLSMDGAGLDIYFKWKKNGIDIPGATSKTLNLTNITQANSGYYNGVIYNQYNSLQTDQVLLYYANPPTITSQSTDNAYKFLGDSNTFFGTATSDIPFSYQWQLSNINIQNATNSTYTINNILSSDFGIYTFTATNANGSVTSNYINLFQVSPPVFILEPSDTSLYAGDNITLLSMASSLSSSINYQWVKNNIDITNATNPYYPIINFTSALTGNYFVKATNGAGVTNSRTFTLSIL